jgi:hypothetical protein
MAIKTEIASDSMKSLLQRFNHISKSVGERGLRTPVGDLLNEAGLELETIAKKQITSDRHVVTGRLRSSIHLKQSTSESFLYNNDKGEQHNGTLTDSVKPGESVIVGTNVEYAMKIETLDSFLYRSAVYLEPFLIKNFKKLVGDAVNGKNVSMRAKFTAS